MRLLYAIYGVIRGARLGLSHEGDVDGIASASLFLRRYPGSVVVLAQPSHIERGAIRWYDWVTWDFVADLPCPARARLYVDHHKTNSPRQVEVAYHDPSAPSAASLAIAALGLEGDAVAEELVRVANDADTGRYSLPESVALRDAIKGAGYRGKLYLARRLAEGGLAALEDSRVRRWVERGREMREAAERMASAIEPRPVLVVEFERDLGISYRTLCLELERRGARELCAVIVPKGRAWRVYLGASRSSRYDCSALASKLGGGGHKFAAGATVRSRRTFYEALKEFLGVREVELILVRGPGDIEAAKR